jgi:CheY-like chemotaxis protein
MADALQHLLTELGHHTVEVVGTGVEAIEAAARWRPDLSIIDVPLDGLINGIEAAQQIRELFGTRALFFSSQSDALTLRMAQAADPFAFVDKTTKRAELARVIQAIASMPEH